MNSWSSYLHSVQQSLYTVGHRRLLLLCGEASWGRALARQALQACAGDWLWLGQGMDADTELGRVFVQARPAQFIGLETAMVVMDVHDGLDPDLFAALAGTVSGGGLMLMPAPPLQQWQQLCSPCAEQAPSLFLRNFVQALQEHPGTEVIEQGREPATAPGYESAAAAVTRQVRMTPDQEQAVQALLGVARGHRNRPLVLLSDRGRGKSSALGIAAATLLQEGRGPIIVTAPRRDATTQVFAHCRRLLGHSEGLEFLAPDALLETRPQGAMILVDEAAALPAPLLQDIVDSWPRVAFATTVHGYEGTGRGFGIRFMDYLRAHYPGSRRLELHTPVRWSAGDPLERFVFDALLLDAQYQPQAADLALRDPEIEIYRDRAELLARPQRLREAFALLVSAHYRTRPRDLCQLLDDPELTVLVAVAEDVVVGVCLLLREAALPAAMIQAVADGRRRARGTIMAQTLLAQLGMPEVGDRVFARIMRIAVHPELRRQGIARRLLAAAEVEAVDMHCDYIGSSYAATGDLLAFWRQLGLHMVYLGLTLDHASGCHSALVMKPLQADHDALTVRLQQRYRQLFHCWLRQGLSRLQPDMVLKVAALLGGEASGLADERVQAYCSSLRGYESCMPEVDRFVFSVLHQPAWEALQPSQRTLLVRRIVQAWSLSDAARDAGLSGQREATHCLRQAVAVLLQACS